MATLREWFKRYWAVESKAPVVKRFVVTKATDVKHRNGIQGGKVGVLGPGTVEHPTLVDVDMNEWFDDARIVRVVGWDPVPANWWCEGPNEGLPEQEQEWWCNKSVLRPFGELEGDVLRMHLTFNLKTRSIEAVWDE
jgi:hypothetical protein